ncbi:outer membrane protein [Sphingomonas fennica]|uniref:Porin family protein n=1 Tax=Edaphosphingomonas fennica TaxID=114404 RepID=A0A2T4I036_9SPHN|nr:porin family protein [Sphingomonas fennica]PTD22084.1 porin family protein [Sphingomonas fennica]
MRKVATALLLASAVAATPALAQDNAGSFAGPRVEGVIGWDRTQANGGHDDGVLYGIGAGYDFQRGNTVFGLETELTDSDVKQCIGAATAADPRLCAKAGRDIYVGGRVGYVVGGSTLLYAKAGYTNGRYKVSADDGTVRISGGQNLDGIRVGAGAEYAIGPNSYLKAEYRYSNYEQGVSRHQALAGFGFRF